MHKLTAGLGETKTSVDCYHLKITSVSNIPLQFWEHYFNIADFTVNFALHDLHKTQNFCLQNDFCKENCN